MDETILRCVLLDLLILDLRYLLNHFYSFNRHGEISRNYGGSYGTVKKSGIDVWTCISADQVGPRVIRLIDGRFGSEAYIKLLDENVLPLCNDHFEPKRPLLHDRFPVHRSKNVLEWIASRQSIFELPLPPKSPELMPLEGIWDAVIDELKTKEIFVQNRNDLWIEVSNMFQQICTVERVTEYVDKIPDIVFNMREKQGDSLI